MPGQTLNDAVISFLLLVQFTLLKKTYIIIILGLRQKPLAMSSFTVSSSSHSECYGWSFKREAVDVLEAAWSLRSTLKGTAWLLSCPAALLRHSCILFFLKRYSVK